MKRKLFKIDIVGIWWKDYSGFLRWFSLSKASDKLKRKKRKKEKSYLISPFWKNPLKTIGQNKSHDKLIYAEHISKVILLDMHRFPSDT